MRYSPLVLMLALVPSTASAQVAAMDLQQRLAAASRVSPDTVIARLMTFDRNQDGRISTDELSERMQPVVARADRSGDGALDVSEIRAVAAAPFERKVGAGGNYNFGDLVGVPMRTRIANAIEDLRLPAVVREQASRIGETYAGEVEDAALVKLREVVAPMLTEEQLAEFEASMKGAGETGGFCVCQTSEMVSTRVVKTSNQSGSVAQEVLIVSLPMLQLRRFQLSADEQRTAIAAITSFNTDRQLDDARRAVLMTRFEGVLSEAEREDLQAALARRPLVKNTAARNVVTALSAVNLRRAQ